MKAAALSFVLMIGCGAASAPRADGAVVTSDPKGSVASRPLVVGDAAPPFRRASVNGKGDVVVPNGKPTLLYLFAFDWGGGPGARVVEELQQRYAARGLVVLGVSHDVSGEDDHPKPAALAEEATYYGLTFPLAWAAPREIGELYRMKHVTAVFVLDAAGRVRFSKFAGKESRPAEDPAVTAAVEDVLRAW